MKRNHKSLNISGLKDRIRLAESDKEIDTLLHEGDGYEEATDATRSLWKRKAKQRRAQLVGGK